MQTLRDNTPGISFEKEEDGWYKATTGQSGRYYVQTPKPDPVTIKVDGILDCTKFVTSINNVDSSTMNFMFKSIELVK